MTPEEIEACKKLLKSYFPLNDMMKNQILIVKIVRMISLKQYQLKRRGKQGKLKDNPNI